MDKLYYIHGKDSSPEGFRANFLRERFPGIRIPTLPNDIEERRAILAESIEPGARVVGNSLGGLSLLDFLDHYPGRVAAMVLIAPAVGFHDPEYRTPEILEFVERLVIPEEITTTVIAAIRDEVVTLEGIEALISRSPRPEKIEYIRLDDDHLMHRESSLTAQIRVIETMMNLTLSDRA